MDWPRVKGIAIDSPCDQSSYQAFARHNVVEKLIAWGAQFGVVSREGITFNIAESGQIRCVANRFIPAKKQILYVPFSFDMTFAGIKPILHPGNKNWEGWTNLKTRIKLFEQAFQWNPYNNDHKDYFSNNVLLAVSVLGMLHRVSRLEEDPPVDTYHSNMLQTFLLYWKAVRTDVGNILYDWTPTELSHLHGSSLFNCIEDARRLGEEMFHHVILPFALEYPETFGENITLSQYLFINSVILTQSFGASTGKKKRSSLLPIIDLVNGKPNDMHNCMLENCAIQKEVNGEFLKLHVLETLCDIHAGEEIILEYAQVGNGEYLLTYNYLPLDPEVIMNNQKTEIYLDLSEFLETELLRMHPNQPPLRRMKREHVYGFFNLPQHIPITMEDLFSQEYSCIPSIRQVLIFLQFDETDAVKAIKTSRIKSQLNPQQLHHLFHMFLKFIECSLGKPRVDLYRGIFGNKLVSEVPGGLSSNTQLLTANMKSAIYLQMSERLVVEVMINRFINLFPENFHDLGYSIMRDHLVSTEINSILEELCKPTMNSRTMQCLVCGSLVNVSKCSRCRKAYYCSPACQKEHWPYHRSVCKPSERGRGGGGEPGRNTAPAPPSTQSSK